MVNTEKEYFDQKITSLDTKIDGKISLYNEKIMNLDEKIENVKKTLESTAKTTEELREKVHSLDKNSVKSFEILSSISEKVDTISKREFNCEEHKERLLNMQTKVGGIESQMNWMYKILVSFVVGTIIVAVISATINTIDKLAEEKANNYYKNVHQQTSVKHEENEPLVKTLVKSAKTAIEQNVGEN